ncbi:LysR family transcriptional regulator [Variovorax sp. J22R133]|uniref:LysR family transcriptional regulator n=1 Tax=Variovorax brevis TaxID=3053503 RepID=UPI00257746A1|nr:LysR family transcriptional regulator [Variovorax sp. J22R133]MDM0114775.1 LysR family transcriptional regulator [Variovorax sp. J22R133]
MDTFSDLAFFTLVIKLGTLAAAAQQMGVTPPSVSKRLAALEARLGVRLLNRTTRRISLTPEGETYVSEGARVLAEMDELERRVAGAKAVPRGQIKLSATLGFGRRHVAPALSKFARAYPEVEVQLSLTERPVNLVEQGFDASIRFGELPDARLTARLMARNKRILCAAPAYLRRAGEPTLPGELQRHHCLFIRESDDTYGTWHLRSGSRHETVKVRGPLSSNDGDCALSWALEGHGILMRSLWDAAPYLRSGRLRPVLPDWSLPNADIYLLFPNKGNMSAKTRVFVDFMLKRFEAHRDSGDPGWGW